jgi:hypothetical protein
MMIRRATGHVTQALAEAGLIAILVTVAIAGTTFAAKPGPAPSTTATCSVTPNPVAVGGLYTFTGTGFRAGELLGVMVTDSHGTQAFNLQADAAGVAAVSSYASWAGTSKVTVNDIGGRKKIFLTSCSFTVG